MELNYHLSVLHKTSYFTTLLLLDRSDSTSLVKAANHFEMLFENKRRTSGIGKLNRKPIFGDYLSIAALRRVSNALEYAGIFLGKQQVTDRTIIKSFRSDLNYLRMHWLLAMYACGNDGYMDSARSSLKNFLDFATDYDKPINETIHYCGFGYVFELAWIWERLFEEQPRIDHAFEIMRGSKRVFSS